MKQITNHSAVEHFGCLYTISFLYLVYQTRKKTLVANTSTLMFNHIVDRDLNLASQSCGIQDRFKKESYSIQFQLSSYPCDKKFV